MENTAKLANAFSINCLKKGGMVKMLHTYVGQKVINGMNKLHIFLHKL